MTHSPECWREHLECAVAKAETLERLVGDYLKGNYKCPASYRPHPCPHGQYWWEACEACIDEHFGAK